MTEQPTEPLMLALTLNGDLAAALITCSTDGDIPMDTLVEGIINIGLRHEDEFFALLTGLTLGKKVGEVLGDIKKGIEDE